MRIIIHDLKKLDFTNLRSDDVVLDSNDSKSCIGCFSCWIKHPFKCILNDKLKYNGKKVFECDELIIISKCVNGCYSSKSKKILERCLSYVAPFFTIRNNEIHHKSRIEKQIDFKTIFYGNIDLEEKEIAKRLVTANMYNLNSKNPSIIFLDKIEDIKENI